MTTKRGEGAGAKFLMDLVGHQGDDCITWPFSKDSYVGRGRVGYLGKPYWAHRLMCIFAYGEPPSPDMHAAHNCGNGHLACVNPKHLEWKTVLGNNRDKLKHGTHVINTSGIRTKLTVEQVREIKSLKGIRTQTSLATEYGVSDANIRGIFAGRWWKYVQPLELKQDM